MFPEYHLLVLSHLHVPVKHVKFLITSAKLLSSVFNDMKSTYISIISEIVLITIIRDQYSGLTVKVEFNDKPTSITIAGT